MIPILYNETETNFENNGIGVLSDVLWAHVQEERNGVFDMEMEYPVTGIWSKELQDFRIIKAKPNDTDEPHLFRIYEIYKSVDGDTITIYASSKTNDFGANLVNFAKVTDATAQEALDAIKVNLVLPTTYNLTSNIETRSSSSWDNTNPLSCIAGESGSIIQRWGGEIQRTNSSIIVHARRGRDRVTTLRVGKGLKGFNQTVSTKGLITCVLPYVTFIRDNEEHTVKGNMVESPLVNNYPVKYVEPVDYNGEEGLFPKEPEDGGPSLTLQQYKAQVLSNLNSKAAGYFSYRNPGSDKPKVTIEADLLELTDSTEFEKFKKLEHIALTDTVVVWVEKFNVDVEVRINKIKYDSLRERVISFTAGSQKSTFYDSVKKEYDHNAETLKEYIRTVENGIYNSIRITADGKNNIFSGYTQPDESLLKVDDIWYKPIANGEIEMHRWDGMSWVIAVQNASKLSIGEIDARKVNLIYLNASNISTGTIVGSNGAWNLNTGEFTLGAVGSGSSLHWNGTKLSIRMSNNEDLEEFINGINFEVGGRNLIKDSERELSYSVARTDEIVTNTLRDGDTVTTSFTAKADNGTHIVDVYFRDVVNGGMLYKSGKMTLTNKFERYSYTTTIEDMTLFNNGMELIFRGSDIADASNEGKTFSVKETQLERGGYLTDWTPATEDMNARFTITNELISTSVSSLEGAISDVRQTAEDVTFAFDNQVIGGENLLKGSDSIAVGDINATPGSDAEYQSQSIGDTFKEHIPEGSPVTISFDVETLSGINSLKVYNSNNLGPQGIEPGYINGIPKGKSRVHVKTTVFHRPESEINRINNFIEFYSVYGSSHFFRIDRIKIEMGHTPSDYSLHPEELSVGITKVNKDGVSVGKSTNAIESSLEYDGVKIMDGKDLIASFNSSGANTPELIAKRIKGDVINTVTSSRTISVGSGKDYETVTEALDSFENAKNLSDSTTITIEVYGEIYDTIRVMGWSGGGHIIIEFKNGARLNGVFRSYGNDCRVTVKGDSSSSYGTIKREGSLSHPVYSLGDKYLRFYYMNLDGAGADASGFYINEGSTGFIYDCDIVNVDHALRVVNGGSLIAYNNRGLCSRYGARSEKGGRMWLKGTVPRGDQGSTSIWDGFRITEGTITMADSMYQVPDTKPVRFNTIYKPTKIYTTGYGETWIATYYGNTAAQGRWHTMDTAMVANFDFGRDIYRYLNDGTDPYVEIRFRRKSSSHGQSAGVAPKPYHFSSNSSFSAVPRGGWTNWVGVPTGTFPSGGTTLTLYSSSVDTGYAIWDACEVRVWITKEV